MKKASDIKTCFVLQSIRNPYQFIHHTVEGEFFLFDGSDEATVFSSDYPEIPEELKRELNLNEVPLLELFELTKNPS